MCCTWFAHNCAWLFECACWRQFAVQWRDCKKSRIVPVNVIVIIIIKIKAEYIIICTRTPQKNIIWSRKKYTSFGKKSQTKHKKGRDSSFGTPTQKWWTNDQCHYWWQIRLLANNPCTFYDMTDRPLKLYLSCPLHSWSPRRRKILTEMWLKDPEDEERPTERWED